mgnify:CR=1 FL=1
MRDVMVDIETFGTSSRAAIASIGAVAFDRDVVGTFDSEMFKVGVSLPSAIKGGGEVDARTIEWWFGQPAAQKAWLGLKHEPITVALEMLRVWFKQVKGELVWANGSNFDLPILDSAYRAHGTKSPWHYRAVRDMRTLGDIAEVGEAEWRKGAEVAQQYAAVEHDPLFDAVEQAVVVQMAFAKRRAAVK